MYTQKFDRFPEWYVCHLLNFSIHEHLLTKLTLLNNPRLIYARSSPKTLVDSREGGNDR